MDFALEENKRKRIAALITLIIALILLFCMWFFRAWNTFDPPLVESGAVVEFGWSNSGSGTTEAVVPQKNPEPQEEATSQVTPTNTSSDNSEEVITDDNSDIAIDESEETVKDSNTENQKETEPVQEEQKNSEELDKAIKNVFDTPAAGDGSSNETGNEGKPEGDKNSKGVINKDGFGVSGDGRDRFEGGIIIPEKPTQEGDVAIDVWIDKNGRFLRAELNLKETTKMEIPKTSTLLKNLAIRAIKNTGKFKRKPGAPGEQKLTIYFKFRLE